jgi:hypothetical protein
MDMKANKPNIKRINPAEIFGNKHATWWRIVFLMALSCSFLSCKDKVEEGILSGVGYDRHVELQWNNISDEVDHYRVLVGTNGKDFSLRGTVSDTIYLDFVSDLGSELQLYYKVEAAIGDKVKTLGEIQVSTREMSEEELLDMVQFYTFRYFWDGAEPNSGMARERIHLDGDYPEDDADVVTTGGTGFGIFGILAGIERQWVTREQGLERFEKMVGFLASADRFNGIWPHWLYGNTGKVRPFSTNDNGADLVESAFLMQGLLAVREYFRDGTEREQYLANKINTLWEEMDWNWHTKDGGKVLYWHWSPDKEWIIQHPIRGYDECFITYILAASSPTHPISAEVFHEGWARKGAIRNEATTYGYELPLKHNGAEEYGGPLFWAHYSFLGLNPNGLSDQYGDYWENNLNHTLVNREWCVQNEGGFKGYGEDLWGLTASYSPEGYSAHHPGNDLGVISPTAALSSIPYTPKESMDVMKNLYYNYGEKVFGKYGFYDALSPEEDWYPQRYLAIDQGPIAGMIENHRTGLGWNLFMSAPEIQRGLEKLGINSLVLEMDDVEFEIPR